MHVNKKPGTTTWQRSGIMLHISVLLACPTVSGIQTMLRAHRMTNCPNKTRRTLLHTTERMNERTMHSVHTHESTYVYLQSLSKGGGVWVCVRAPRNRTDPNRMTNRYVVPVSSTNCCRCSRCFAAREKDTSRKLCTWFLHNPQAPIELVCVLTYFYD